MKIMIIGLLLVSQVFAQDPDNFLNRDKILKLPSALGRLNEIVNHALRKSVRKVNGDNACLSNLHEILEQELMYEFQEEIGHLSSIEVLNPPIKNVFHHRELPPTAKRDVYVIEEIIPSLNLEGNVVGLDKFPEFFFRGMVNYKKKLARKSWDEIFSKKMNKIHVSYADHAASFAGALFWNQLRSTENPYVKCEQDQLRIVRKFSWTDYVNDSWDEGINPTKFQSGYTSEVILSNIQDNNLTMPVELGRCQVLSQMNCATYLVSPVCLGMAGRHKNSQCLEEEFNVNLPFAKISSQDQMKFK